MSTAFQQSNETEIAEQLQSALDKYSKALKQI
jgi:hypothetical protein